MNAISAGPIKTLAAKGISGFSSILQTYHRFLLTAIDSWDLFQA